MEAAAKREERMRKIRGVKDEEISGEKNNNKKGKVCGGGCLHLLRVFVCVYVHIYV
jgi:hypothetical protein